MVGGGPRPATLPTTEVGDRHEGEGWLGLGSEFELERFIGRGERWRGISLYASVMIYRDMGQEEAAGGEGGESSLAPREEQLAPTLSLCPPLSRSPEDDALSLI